MSFKINQERYLKLINEKLKFYLSSESEYYQVLFESMKYSVNAGGKRIRPVLMLATAEMLGIELEVVLPFACALEMIHASSLIHDDLPIMDDDDMRRGIAANHKVFGNSVALLAGDALLIKPFEIIANGFKLSNDKDIASRWFEATSYLAECSGDSGMIAGQIMDIEAENKKIDLPELISLHQHKTGALFNAAVIIPCILGGCSEQTTNTLKTYSNSLGLAFQIVDDILDVIGEEEMLGKPVGSDAQMGKTTYVDLVGLDNARAMVTTLTKQANDALKSLDVDSEVLSDIVTILANRYS